MSVSRHTSLLRGLLILALVGPSLAPRSDAAHAAPTNARIEQARKDAEAARVRLDELAADLEERTEDYFEIDAELNETRDLIRDSERDLALALSQLDTAESRLNGRAATIYRKGAVDLIAVVVGATDFRDLVTRLDLMQRIGRSDAGLVRDVKIAKERIETTQASLERRREEQVVLRDRARRAQAEMQSAVDQQKKFISDIDSELEKLIAEERERQERLAREAAERAARLAGGNVGRAGRPFDPSALGAAHPEVIPIARRYVNKTPYVWGGTTPAGFDCSGLVLYCYRELGIALPRTSRQQYLVGAYIPPDRLDLLKSGDLVFFGRGGDPGRIHHVAIYVGDGQMIHAPQTGELVKEASLMARISSRGDYVGAVRP